jgi:hypothetical protein
MFTRNQFESLPHLTFPSLGSACTAPKSTRIRHFSPAEPPHFQSIPPCSKGVCISLKTQGQSEFVSRLNSISSTLLRHTFPANPVFTGFYKLGSGGVPPIQSPQGAAITSRFLVGDFDNHRASAHAARTASRPKCFPARIQRPRRSTNLCHTRALETPHGNRTFHLCARTRGPVLE